LSTKKDAEKLCFGVYKYIFHKKAGTSSKLQLNLLTFLYLHPFYEMVGKEMVATKKHIFT